MPLPRWAGLPKWPPGHQEPCRIFSNLFSPIAHHSLYYKYINHNVSTKAKFNFLLSAVIWAGWYMAGRAGSFITPAEWIMAAASIAAALLGHECGAQPWSAISLHLEQIHRALLFPARAELNSRVCVCAGVGARRRVRGRLGSSLPEWVPQPSTGADLGSAELPWWTQA